MMIRRRVRSGHCAWLLLWCVVYRPHPKYNHLLSTTKLYAVHFLFFQKSQRVQWPSNLLCVTVELRAGYGVALGFWYSTRTLVWCVNDGMLPLPLQPAAVSFFFFRKFMKKKTLPNIYLVYQARSWRNSPTLALLLCSDFPPLIVYFCLLVVFPFHSRLPLLQKWVWEVQSREALNHELVQRCPSLTFFLPFSLAPPPPSATAWSTKPSKPTTVVNPQPQPPRSSSMVVAKVDGPQSYRSRRLMGTRLYFSLYRLYDGNDGYE